MVIMGKFIFSFISQCFQIVLFVIWMYIFYRIFLHFWRKRRDFWENAERVEGTIINVNTRYNFEAEFYDIKIEVSVPHNFVPYKFYFTRSVLDEREFQIGSKIILARMGNKVKIDKDATYGDIRFAPDASKIRSVRLVTGESVHLDYLLHRVLYDWYDGVYDNCKILNIIDAESETNARITDNGTVLWAGDFVTKYKVEIRIGEADGRTSVGQVEVNVVPREE